MIEQLIMEENGKRYRMLQVGETLEAGDEVNLVHSGGWQTAYCPQCLPNTVMPIEHGAMPVGFYRRPIE